MVRVFLCGTKGSRKNKFAEMGVKCLMYLVDLSEQNHSNPADGGVTRILQAKIG